MENLTKTTGEYIRNILRNDSSFKSILGITANPENYIFLGVPTDQIKGFTNPRVNIHPLPSNADELAYTGIFQGPENFRIRIYVNDTYYNTIMDALDRIVTLFNKTSYSITNNIGEFEVSGKISLPDPDKDNTDIGDINITLKIGGI